MRFEIGGRRFAFALITGRDLTDDDETVIKLDDLSSIVDDDDDEDVTAFGFAGGICA